MLRCTCAVSRTNHRSRTGFRRRGRARAIPRPVQPIEQLAQLVGAGVVRLSDQLVEDMHGAVLGDLAEILGEEAPDALEQEVTQDVGAGGAGAVQLLAQIDDMNDGLARQLGLPAREDRLASGEEEQGVVLIGQVDQIEHDARRGREGAGLPDLKLVEGTEDDVRRSGVFAGIRGVSPVVERCLRCSLSRFASPGASSRSGKPEARSDRRNAQPGTSRSARPLSDRSRSR